MKQHARSILFSLTLLCAGLATPALAQLTDTSVQSPPAYDTFTPPSVGGTYVDPVFGSTISRVSDALNTVNADRGGKLSWIENEYATMSAFNSDNSKFILVHESYFALYDGSGAYVRDLPLEINSSSEPRWSRKDQVTIYYHAGNQLKSYDIVSGTTAVVHSFNEYASISGQGEMDISEDGDHLVLTGDGHAIFVYQISSGKKYNALETAGHTFDSVYITPNNNVTVTWTQAGTARYAGIELFDSNMNFQRQVAHAGGHMDVTRDTNGDEVLVWTNSNDSQPIPNCNNGVVKIRLADASQKCLAQLDWSLAVHISAPDGNGTVFVDTEAPSNPAPGSSSWVPYTNEILQVKLDGSGVMRLAHHRSRRLNNYNWQPKVSTSRDGSRLLFASNFDLPVIDGYDMEYSDTYLIRLNGASTPPPPGGTPPPAPSPNPTSETPQVIRFEQDNSAVQKAGAWYWQQRGVQQRRDGDDGDGRRLHCDTQLYGKCSEMDRIPGPAGPVSRECMWMAWPCRR